MANHHPLFNAITLDAPASQIVLYTAKVYGVDPVKMQYGNGGYPMSYIDYVYQHISPFCLYNCSQYNEYRASFEISSLNVIAGSVPAKVRGLVEEWAELHKDELLRMWNSKDFHKIKPLV